MDLRRHLQVVWRFRRIAAGGFVLAVAVALLASFHVSTSGLTWRSDQTFTSTSTLFVTQTGFPWGRVTLPSASLQPSGIAGNEGTEDSESTSQKRREYGAPERFSDLAVVYSYIARSDQVRGLVAPRPKPDQIVITPVTNPSTGANLPLLLMETHATDQGVAQNLNKGVISALRKYLEEEQEASDIAEDERVRVQVLNPPTPAGVTEGRTYMASVVAFIMVLAATLAIIYLLENLRLNRPARGRCDVGDGPGSNGHAPLDPNLDGLALDQEWAETQVFEAPSARRT
jgi:hypothetical protein